MEPLRFSEDHLVEQPAIQLMQHELGWEVGENIEHRTPNIERRSEEKRKKQTKPTLQRLNPDLPVEAIEGAAEDIDFLISLKMTVSPSAETADLTEIERLQDFTRTSNFTTC